MIPQLDHTEATPQLSEPQEYRIFLQRGNDIVNNGTRFASIECLQEEFPEAAILPAKETSGNWEDLCVQDNALAPAAEEVVAARKAAEMEAKQSVIRQQRDKMITGLMWLQQRHIGQTNAGIEPSLTAEEYKEFETYLQSLRDITGQASFKESSEVEWPDVPEFLK